MNTYNLINIYIIILNTKYVTALMRQCVLRDAVLTNIIKFRHKNSNKFFSAFLLYFNPDL